MTIESRGAGEAGFSLIEILFAIGVLALMMLGVTNGTVTTYQTLNEGIAHTIANRLALSKLEELQGIDPSTLTAANNTNETGLTQRNLQFTRATTIVVNADGSRTASVAVTGSGNNGRATYNGRLALWGNN